MWDVIIVLLILSCVVSIYGVKKLNELIGLQREANRSLSNIENSLLTNIPGVSRSKVIAGSKYFYSEIVDNIINLIKEGGYSASGIALKLNVAEPAVAEECIRLYKEGIITKSDCERVLMRQINL